MQQSIEAYVEAQLRRAGIPGAALAVVQDGAVLTCRGFGTTDQAGNQPVTANTLFEIGPVTMSMVATAVLRLRDRGLLDLDTPVQRYLPWFYMRPASRAARITLRHLLTHTSGLPANAESVVWRAPERIRPSLEAGVRALKTLWLTAEPGSRHAYSNMNYAVLGLVVEAVTGQRWENYLQEQIFLTLAMTRTTAEPRPDPDTVQPYQFRMGRLEAVPLDPYGPYKGPAARVLSTAADMARYALAQLDGDLLPEASRREAQTGDPLTGGQYGLGWSTAPPLVYHTGGTQGCSAIIVLLPERRAGVVLLTNALSAAVAHIALGAARMLAGEMPTPIRPATDPYRLVSWAMRATAYTGIALWGGLGIGVAIRATLPAGLAPLLLLTALGIAGTTLLVGRSKGLPNGAGIKGWPVDLVQGMSALLSALTAWSVYGFLG